MRVKMRRMTSICMGQEILEIFCSHLSDVDISVAWNLKVYHHVLCHKPTEILSTLSHLVILRSILILSTPLHLVSQIVSFICQKVHTSHTCVWLFHYYFLQLNFYESLFLQNPLSLLLPFVPVLDHLSWGVWKLIFIWQARCSIMIFWMLFTKTPM